jgi:hypothetical protein
MSKRQPQQQREKIEMQTDLDLLNFRIPKHMKKQFQETCQSRHQQMTSVINHFIADFINEHQRRHEDEAELPLAFFSDDEPTL